MRWLTGSLNGADLGRGRARRSSRWSCWRRCCSAQTREPVGCCSSATTPRPRSASASSGPALLVIVAAVGLIAFATAACRARSPSSPSCPGPIAARIVGPGGSLLMPGRARRRPAGAGRRPRRPVRLRRPASRSASSPACSARPTCLPDRPHQPRRRLAVTARPHTLDGRGAHARLRRPHRHRGPRPGRPARAGSRRSSAPTPAASRRCCGRCRGCSRRAPARCCSTARRCTGMPAKELARTLGLLPAVADRARGHHRRRPRRPRPPPAPGHLLPLEHGGRRRRRRGARGDRDRRPGRPARRRALRRAAPAGLDRDGARPADRPAAARRADDVPRRQPPDRGPRPAHRPQPRRAARRSSWCCTTSTWPPATPTTWSRSRTAGSTPPAPPREVLTEETVRAVFGLDSRVIVDPISGTPLMLPIGRHHTAEPLAAADRAT